MPGSAWECIVRAFFRPRNGAGEVFENRMGIEDRKSTRPDEEGIADRTAAPAATAFDRVAEIPTDLGRETTTP